MGGAIIVLSILAMYLWISLYYSDGFSYGTWINGIECTGKSIDQIDKELTEKNSYEGLTILAKDGKSYTISAEEVGFSASYEQPLTLYQQKQNPYLWIDNLLKGKKDKMLSPAVTYDREKFEKKLKKLGITEEKADDNRKVEILKGERGYYLVNERTGILDSARAKELIYNAFDNREPIIDLDALDCYYDLPLTQDMQDTLSLWDRIDKYQNCGIIYQMGVEQIPVDAGVVCNFLLVDEEENFVLDENGNLCTDENKVFAFVDALADQYDTVGKARQFHATRGEIITVEGGIYGNQIDRKAEKEYLLSAFLSGKDEIHTPEYIQMSICQGPDDIGDTYIEVDMTQQMLYYYSNGELMIETPVVTGNTSLRRGTPSGTNYVYAKQRNRTLKGADYESFVQYWIPVKGAVGIHDASWRSSYGGEIYKSNGSHGCINTPLEEVSKLYDMVEIGTPCIMFY